MEFFRHTLSNGIRLIHKSLSAGQVVHCGLMVNAGSRDELEHEQGLAHYIEHCLFKGTSKRKAFHILNRMDSVGAELNAYTTKEETAIYASFLKEHFERAIEVISDITFNSTFPEKEIKKEKDVILDEINSYLDNPAELIFDDFEELVFAGHPIGRNILGTLDSVKSFTRKDILNFVARHYTTDQIVFSSVGNIPFDTVKRLAEKHLGAIPARTSTEKRLPVHTTSHCEKEVEMDTFQAHYTIGGPAYCANNPRKTALILLNNYLGGPAMNSKLNMNIRERHGIAYNIESNYQPHSDTGIIEIYLGTDKALLNRSKKLVFKELQQIREKKMSPTLLHRTKMQIKGQIALGQEGAGSLMLSMGRSVLLYDKIDTTAEIFQRIDKIQAEELLEIANEIFDPQKLSSLTYL